MAGAVAGEKRNPLAAQRAQHIGPRWLAEGRGQRDLAAVGDLRHVVQTTAADDADLDSFHVCVVMAGLKTRLYDHRNQT